MGSLRSFEPDTGLPRKNLRVPGEVGDSEAGEMSIEGVRAAASSMRRMCSADGILIGVGDRRLR